MDTLITIQPKQADSWPICRRYSELELSRRLTLLQWAERGRLLSGDYIFDPDHDTWTRAREQAELRMFFQRRRARQAQRVIALLLVLAALSLFAATLPATVLVFSAALIFVYYSGALLSLPARPGNSQRRIGSQSSIRDPRL